MKRFILLFALLAATAVAAVPKGGPQYQTDSGTVGFLRRHLISGADLQYPIEAQRLKQQGSLFLLMKLRPDGTVESLTAESVTGDAVFEEQVKRALKSYRFKPKTKGPLMWLVSFAQPATVIVKVYRVKEPKASASPGKN